MSTETIQQPDIAKPPSFHEKVAVQVKIPDDPNKLHETWKSGGRIPCLNGIRAMAILLVVLSHSCETSGFPLSSLGRILHRGGRIGVEVTFVLSGFLITTLLLREKSHARCIDVKGFYLRRMLRLMPEFAALLLVVAVLQVFGHAYLRGWDWLAACTYTVNFLHLPAWEIGHLWSLSIEEHFYLIWPLTMVALSALGSRHVALLCIIGCFAARWAVLMFLPEYSRLAELWTFTRMDGIAWGCLLALLVWDPVWRSWLSALVRSNRFVIVLLLAFILIQAGAFVSDKLDVGLS